MDNRLAHIKRLLLFDYDGVCVKPGWLTRDSLNWKANDALQLYGFPPLTDEEWSYLANETAGTTQPNLIHIQAYAP